MRAICFSGVKSRRTRLIAICFPKETKKQRPHNAQGKGGPLSSVEDAVPEWEPRGSEDSVFRYEENKTGRFRLLLDAVGTRPKHIGDPFTQSALSAQLRKQIITVSAVDHVDRSDRGRSNAAAY